MRWMLPTALMLKLSNRSFSRTSGLSALHFTLSVFAKPIFSFLPLAPVVERVHVQVTNPGKSADFRLKSGVGNDVVELPASHVGDIVDRFLQNCQYFSSLYVWGCSTDLECIVVGDVGG